MSEAETEQFLVVFEDPPEQRSKTRMRVRMVAGFIVFVTVIRLVPFVTWHSEQQPDGDRISVMNVWSQSISYVHGHPPNWQRQKLSDGSVLEGPLKNGLRTDHWVMKHNGAVIESIEYWNGEVVSPKDQQEQQ